MWLKRTLLVLVLFSAGCRPLYLPPVPEPLVLPDGLRVLGTAQVVDDRPRLRLSVSDAPREGWLAVQWFGPDNREKASESVWIDPSDEGHTHRLDLPPAIAADPGRWRAIVSFEGIVARQFSFEVQH